jgi:hypothetical protein
MPVSCEDTVISIKCASVLRNYVCKTTRKLFDQQKGMTAVVQHLYNWNIGNVNPSWATLMSMRDISESMWHYCAFAVTVCNCWIVIQLMKCVNWCLKCVKTITWTKRAITRNEIKFLKMRTVYLYLPPLQAHIPRWRWQCNHCSVPSIIVVQRSSSSAFTSFVL